MGFGNWLRRRLGGDGDPLQRIRHKLGRLRALDKGLDAFGAYDHRYRLNPCVPEAEVRSFESKHGVLLPEGFRAFLTEIGNGGAGPDYGLGGLDKLWIRGTLAKPFPLTEAYAPEILRGESGFDDACEERLLAPYQDGNIVIGHKGCAYYNFLVVTGNERGNVWYDFTASDGGYEPAKQDFLTWYEAWLDQWLSPGAVDREKKKKGSYPWPPQ